MKRACLTVLTVLALQKKFIVSSQELESDKPKAMRRMFVCLAGLGKINLETETFMKKVENAQYSVDIIIPPEEMKFEERPTVVLIHGWKGFFHSEKAHDASSPNFDNIRKTYLKKHDVNVVTVKWQPGHFATYGTDVHFLPQMAKKVAAYLDEKLGTNQILWRNLTIVGHSLGAHLSGFIGKNVKNGKVGTIIGLDPAGPRFEEAGHKQRLDKSDAEYVECIHTSTNCYGLKKPVCTADFYPNSGYNQEGCGFWIIKDYNCDHVRAHVYYLESIHGENRFRAMKCQNFLAKCDRNHDAFMGGYPGNLGNNVNGTFYLATNTKSPFGKG